MRPGPVLLDTGPLLTYLALLYADSINAPELYRDTLFRDIRRDGKAFGEIEQERFAKLIEAAPRPNDAPSDPGGHKIAGTLRVGESRKLR
jgi:hypothetical protein